MKHTPKIDWKIIVKKINGTISDAERDAFDAWYNSSEDNRKYYEETIKYRKAVDGNSLKEINISKAKSSLQSRRRQQKAKTKTIKLFRYAAMFIIPLAVGALLFNIAYTDFGKQEIAKIEPITNKAQLTLSSGKKIFLSENSAINSLIENDGTRIHNHNNSISYLGSKAKQKETSQIIYNEINIPRGGEYQMTLSDGTKVWLNSGSSLKFPVSFSSNIREVKLEGEAYFKVKKNASKPFIVKTHRGDIKVLGTSFNVFAYKNEDISHTTLVEGKIEYSDCGKKRILKPGDQALSSKEGEVFKVQKVNTELYTAWKNGLFVFEEESLESLTNKLSLWYGVEFFFANEEAKNYKLSGHMKRYEEFDDILKLIENIIDVKFKTKGKTITVYKR